MLPLNELGRSQGRQTQDIITTLSPLLASLVPSSIPTVAQVVCQIPKLCGGILRQEDQKANLGYRSYKRMGKILLLEDAHVCVSECLCVGDLGMSIGPHEHV